jgi:ABC-2 type transport system ATP-binding protein
MIKIESLKKRYDGETVLDIPELEIPRGECFGLVGNNGAGKTTLFRTILDLIRPNEGRVLLEGTDVSKDEDWKMRVGAYLDEHMLLTFLTPDEYFETLRKMYGMSMEDLKLHLVKFEDFFNGEILSKKKYIRDLSKGNVKKTGIAAALMGNPEVILLDEPFENLDPSSQIRLKKLILKERNERQTTFLISSHDLVHVTDICERIVLLEKGRIIHNLKEQKQVMVDTLEAYFER